MRIAERLLLQAFIMLSVLPAFAQNGINSPYSRYGVGSLSDQGVGINKAMGGIGIGLHERNTLNTLNPASFSTVDTLTFLFDAGLSLTNGNYKENDVRVNARNSSLDYLAMQFRIVRNLGFTASIMPYSNVGYSFSESSVIRDDQDGELISTNSYAGEGGLRQISAGLGWAPFKFLSVGATAGYIYGELTHTISNTYSVASVLTRSKTYYSEMKGFKATLGVQASFEVLKGQLAVGAVWSPATNFKGDGLIYDQILDGNTSETTDTLRLYDKFSIPSSVGFGITYSREKWLVGADFSMDAWSGVTLFGDDSFKGNDRIKVSFGGMFQPEKNNSHLFRRSSYRAGLYLAQPYYCINDRKGPMEYGASIGISLPVINRWNNKIEFNISGQYAHLKPSEPGMIEENYIRLNLGIAFNERWFTKWMVE